MFNFPFVPHVITMQHVVRFKQLIIHFTVFCTFSIIPNLTELNILCCLWIEALKTHLYRVSLHLRSIYRNVLVRSTSTSQKKTGGHLCLLILTQIQAPSRSCLWIINNYWTRLSKISWFVSISQINYLPQPLASANNWSARHRQITIFCNNRVP